jgi:PIN domain nuclease of toxin-antitoxin system
MTRYLLDTSALLTLQDDEAYADRVAEVLRLAGTGSAKCFGCFISLMEIHHIAARDHHGSQWPTTTSGGRRSRC